MDKLIIEGGHPLRGSLPVSGSKNTALPLMAAALLTGGRTTITQVPVLKDISTFSQVLQYVGADLEFDAEKKVLTIDGSSISGMEAPYELVKKMRASFYMLGALLGRFGRAKVSLPGGCAWGPRPVDLHIQGMQALGADVELDSGYVIASAPGGRLRGGRFRFDISSVGASINVMLAAVLASGTTRLENVAIEPDVIEFGRALQKMGAQIEGLGSRTLEIEGVDELHPVTLHNCPDRIELGTFMIAAAMAGRPGRSVHVTHAQPEYLGRAFIEAFEQTGAVAKYRPDSVEITAPEQLNPVSIETDVYPGFPTDLQAQWTVMMACAPGTSQVRDTIYSDRFKHIPELNRLGIHADIQADTVTIVGGHPIKGAPVMSTDLRASVSLVLAGMVAEGETHVLRVYHLDRGYENLEGKLAAAGISIRREPFDEFEQPVPHII